MRLEEDFLYVRLTLYRNPKSKYPGFIFIRSLLPISNYQIPSPRVLHQDRGARPRTHKQSLHLRVRKVI